METTTQTLSAALEELDRVAPGAPLLALGQTVFWDEPMKAGVALAAKGRPFVAGVHDTDYFAKLPGEKGGKGYRTAAHNDGSTRSLWSAAAEFSSLFGSETVITREILQRCGLRLGRLLRTRPSLLNEATEAWGWRAVVSLEEHPPVAAEIPLAEVEPELMKALDWAIEETLSCVSEPDRALARERADHLRALVQKHRDGKETLADLYAALLPDIYQMVAGEPLDIQTARTTDLLRFNRASYCLPRFDLLNHFLDPDHAALARKAYDDAVAHTEIYPLDRFMSGAIPFDLVVPGRGRGTIRIAKRAVVIMTPEPIFISLKKPIASAFDLADAIESKLGPNCTLIGKAVALIGMLAREHVFVFHEGASSYLHLSRKMHQQLAEAGLPLRLNPVLRVHYRAWDAMAKCHSWLKLPEPLHGPFGTEELCAPSLSARWKDVAAEQTLLLEQLGSLTRPIDLIAHLGQQTSGSWQCLAQEYAALHERLAESARNLAAMKADRMKLYDRLRVAIAARLGGEKAKGDHFRARIFQQEAAPAALAQRQAYTEQIDEAIHTVRSLRQQIRTARHAQKAAASDPSVLALHERRREIEREAELKRLRLIRSAVIATSGLRRAGARPAAWWFPVVCSDGGWFRETIASAQVQLEPLT